MKSVTPSPTWARKMRIVITEFMDPRAVARLQAVHDVLYDAAEPDMEVFEALSERMQETIRACQEWNKEKSTVAKSSGMAGMDDDIPF